MAHPTYLGRIEFFRRFGYRSSAHRCEDQDLLLRSYSTCDHQNKLWMNMKKSQDQDLLLRCFSHVRFANIPRILLGYREERLDLRKLFASRRYLIDSIRYEFMRQGKPVAMARGIVEQALKMGLDVVAIKSGLNYRLLRHRARPASVSERTQWERVWAELTAPEA
jgi:hypothetical protein